MITPPLQFAEKMPSFIFWSLNTGFSRTDLYLPRRPSASCMGSVTLVFLPRRGGRPFHRAAGHRDPNVSGITPAAYPPRDSGCPRHVGADPPDVRSAVMTVRWRDSRQGCRFLPSMDTRCGGRHTEGRGGGDDEKRRYPDGPRGRG